MALDLECRLLKFSWKRGRLRVSMCRLARFPAGRMSDMMTPAGLLRRPELDLILSGEAMSNF